MGQDPAFFKELERQSPTLPPIRLPTRHVEPVVHVLEPPASRLPICACPRGAVSRKVQGVGQPQGGAVGGQAKQLVQLAPAGVSACPYDVSRRRLYRDACRGVCMLGASWQWWGASLWLHTTCRPPRKPADVLFDEQPKFQAFMATPSENKTLQTTTLFCPTPHL